MMSKADTNISAVRKEVYISAKETYICAKEPYICANAPHICTSETNVTSKVDTDIYGCRLCANRCVQRSPVSR